MPSTKPPSPIRIAIAGVGNCASSLIQGITYYSKPDNSQLHGIMLPNIGGFNPTDIQVVAAFDIDKRKVGLPLSQAIFAKPNCTRIFEENPENAEVVVSMGPILDGVAPHMQDYSDDEAFRPADLPADDVTQILKASQTEVLVNYMPVGSEQASKFYAQACLDAGVAFINCVPVFIASTQNWADRFKAANLPIIGDDIKSQIGATITHRMLGDLFTKRGYSLKKTYQLNTGGNTDFLNMLSQDRLASKKKSKTNSVQSQMTRPLPAEDIHIGPSDYVAWQKDNKVAFIRLEGEGFGGAPIEMEMRLSVQDSPNSAGVVIDAIRCAKFALERGISGVLSAPSALYMKSPAEQMNDHAAYNALNQFLHDEQ